MWRRQPYISEASPIIVGGCSRSRTTLMRRILDSHPNICCGPESELFLPGRPGKGKLKTLTHRYDLPFEPMWKLLKEKRSQAEFIDRFFAEYYSLQGKLRWAEKTPRNILVLDYIFRSFPQARFIHVIRDGRDTVCSLRTHPRRKVIGGKRVELNTRNPLSVCVKRWLGDVRAGVAYRRDPRYIEIRYEDVVLNTEETLRTLLGFLGEDWDEGVLQSGSHDVRKFQASPHALRPIYTSAIGRWRTELTRKEVALFKGIAGPLLKELGYVSDDRWEPTIPTN